MDRSVTDKGRRKTKSFEGGGEDPGADHKSAGGDARCPGGLERARSNTEARTGGPRAALSGANFDGFMQHVC